MHRAGGVDLPDESDDTKLKPNGGYFNDLPLSNDFGGWQWHINVKQSIELELNDDNSVLSAVDFKARSVVESGDPTALMAFHFAQERAALGITSHALGSDSRPSVRLLQPTILIQQKGWCRNFNLEGRRSV